MSCGKEHELIVVKMKEIEIGLESVKDSTEKHEQMLSQLVPAIASLPEMRVSLESTCARVNNIEKELTGTVNAVGLKHTVTAMAEDVAFLKKSFTVVIIVGVLVCLALTGREELLSIIMKVVR